METAPSCRIRVLPPALADQIAAGEVVERPASVVKELVENALDAGARRIDVEIEGGGRRLVRVLDDGSGMTAEEARLALMRHATSKLERAEDLWSLASFGFRGEALPSIAAVSRLAVRTKMRGASAGFRLLVEGGSEREAGEVGMPDGTQIEVRDLFFNTPARQKFLKAEATETANVTDTMLRLALGHPEVHFRLRAGGRVALELPVHAEPRERAWAVLARRGAGALHEAEGQEQGCRVRAYLASPEEAPTTPRSTFLFVARRPVRDRSLLHALAMGYGELIEKGRYPLAALFVEVPGGELDVNVHPQKLEVRFARAQDVYAAVRHVVAEAVARSPWLHPAPAALRAYTMPPARGRDGDEIAMRLARVLAARPPASEPRARAGYEESARGEDTVLRDHGLERPYGEGGGNGAAAGAAFFATLDYIGQLHRTYLVCQGTEDLILVDQHAAHERVEFQRLRVAHRQRAIARQRLLFPLPVEIDESAAAALGADALAALAELGFEVERFGAATLLVRGVPELLKAGDPKVVLLDVIHRLIDGTQPELAGERLDHVFATMACHSVVRAGDALGREQALALLGQLDAVDLRSHCLHGRPVLLRMSIAEIERRFGRT